MQHIIQNDMEELWKFNETRRYLRISRSTLLRWMTIGIITGHKVGSTWRFKKSDVLQFVNGPEKTPEQGEE